LPVGGGLSFKPEINAPGRTDL